MPFVPERNRLAQRRNGKADQKLHPDGPNGEVKKQEQLLQKESSKVMCQACDGENEAMSRCMECEQYLCHMCKKAHQRWAALRTHKITPLEALQGDAASKTLSTKSYMSKCEVHSNQELCYYCNTCEQLICKTCAASGHKQPKYSFVNLKTAIDICLIGAREIVSHVVKYNTTNTAIQIPTNWLSSRKRLSMMLAQTKKQISKKAEMEVAKIRQKETQLLQEAQVAFRKKDKKLAELIFAEHTMGRVHSEMTDANCLDILKLRQELLHDYKDVVMEQTNDITPELSFISFSESQNEINVGSLLLKEKWIAKSNSNVTGEFIASLSTCDVVVVNKGQKKLTKLSPDSKVLHECTIGQLEGKDLSEAMQPTNFKVNKDDQLILLLGSEVKIFNKEYQLLRQFTPGEESDIDATPTCLAVDDSNLVVVGYKDQGKISLHNPDGSFIKTLPAPSIENYMTVSSRCIMYTNFTERKLAGVDYEGNIRFTVLIYQGQAPRGLVCDKAGDIYVVTTSNQMHNYYGTTHQIHHYSAEGKYIGVLVSDQSNHCDITFTPNGQLAVTGSSLTSIYNKV